MHYILIFVLSFWLYSSLSQQWEPKKTSNKQNPQTPCVFVSSLHTLTYSPISNLTGWMRAGLHHKYILHSCSALADYTGFGASILAKISRALGGRLVHLWPKPVLHTYSFCNSILTKSWFYFSFVGWLC